MYKPVLGALLKARNTIEVDNLYDADCTIHEKGEYFIVIDDEYISNWGLSSYLLLSQKSKTISPWDDVDIERCFKVIK